MTAPPPPIVLVHGLPGSGKTTLAGDLARHLHVPLLAKDAVKEALFDSLGVGDRAWAVQLGAAANQVLWAVAARCPAGVVMETWLDPARGDLALARHGLQRVGVAPTCELICACPPAEAARRYLRRNAEGARHRGHMQAEGDVVTRIHRAASLLEPLGLGPVLWVDTTRPVNPAELARQVRGEG